MEERCGNGQNVVGGVAFCVLTAMLCDTGAKVVEGNEEGVVYGEGADDVARDCNSMGCSVIGGMGQSLSDGVGPQSLSAIMVSVECNAIGRRENEIAGVGIGDVDKYAVVGETNAGVKGSPLELMYGIWRRKALKGCLPLGKREETSKRDCGTVRSSLMLTEE